MDMTFQLDLWGRIEFRHRQKKGKAIPGEGISNSYPRHVGTGSPDPRKMTTCLTTDTSSVTFFPSSRVSFLSASMVGLLELLVPGFPPIQDQPVLVQLVFLTSGREAKSQRVTRIWSYLVIALTRTGCLWFSLLCIVYSFDPLRQRIMSKKHSFRHGSATSINC